MATCPKKARPLKRWLQLLKKSYISRFFDNFGSVYKTFTTWSFQYARTKFSVLTQVTVLPHALALSKMSFTSYQIFTTILNRLLKLIRYIGIKTVKLFGTVASKKCWHWNLSLNASKDKVQTSTVCTLFHMDP